MIQSGWPFCIVFIVLSVSAGCAHSPHAQCEAAVDDATRLLDEPPADKGDLLNLLTGEESHIQKVRADSGRKLAWFYEGRDSVTLCSYRPSRDTCKRDIYAVNYRLADGKWMPVGDLVPLTVCIQLAGGSTKGR